MQMSNMVPKFLLYNMYYAAPVGRSRRHELSAQLFTGVQRINFEISYNLQSLASLGSNPISTTAGLVFQVPDKEFFIPTNSFNATELANTSELPCIFAISYELALCVPLLDYVAFDGDNFHFTNISDSFIGHDVLLVCLWKVNVGTAQIPVWRYGRFALQP